MPGNDNVGYTPGSGATIAADDVSGVLYQRVKIGVGVDGVATDVSATNPMPVSGTFYQATQPVSIATMPSTPVTGTFWQATQPVSAASLPLPSGAATAGKQPALGTAGTPSADVLTVQGAASMTALKVDGSAVTQPVSGTFWQTTQPVSGTVTANAGTNLNTSALAVESGGNLATLVTRTPAVGQTTMSGSRPVVIASDQSALSVNYSAAATQTYSVAGVITINTVLLTLDLSQYRGASIQCTSMGTTGVVTPEWSNDNATWIAATIFTPPGASATTFSAAGLWNVQKQARYLRLRLSTATTAGTTTIYTETYQTKPQAWFATQPVSMATNTPTLAAGTNLAADVGVQYRASATGGATIKHVIAAAGTNATSVKASAGRVIGWSFSNTTATYKYVRLYNLATSPTVGTSTVIQTIGIPPNGIAQMNFPGGIGYATGIALSITGAAADNDTTVVVANDVVGDLFYA
jgi:hypothetical protein